MKRMSPETKRRVIGGVAVFLAALMILGAIAPFLLRAAEPSPVSPGLKIEAEAGIQGMYKLNQPVNVRLRLSNEGSGFSGNIEIKINTTPYDARASYQVYSYPVELPEGGVKQITMEVNIPWAIREFKAEASDSRGRVAASAVIPLTPLYESAFLVAALCPSGGLEYISSVKCYDNYYGEYREIGENLLCFTEKDILFASGFLENFDAIIINDYDTRSISGEELSALTEWVEKGGLLVLGTGANLEKVTAGLSENFFPQDKKTPGIVTDYFEEENYQAGLGTVAVFSIDLADKAILRDDASFTSLEAALRGLFSSGTQGWYSGASYYDELANLCGNLPNLGGNMINVIFGALAVYVIILCPALYLTLKKLKKKELGFIALPCLAAVMTVIVALMSFSTVYSKPILNSVSIIETADSSSIGSAVIKTGAFSPGIGSLTVRAEDNITLRLVNDSRYYYSSYSPQSSQNQQEGEVNVRLSYGADPGITFYNKARWDGGYFETARVIDMGGGIHAELEYSGSAITGIISNRSNFYFDELIVFYGGISEVYTGVAPGEELSVIMQADSSSGSVYYGNIPQLPYGYNEDKEDQRRRNIKQQLLNLTEYQNPLYSTSGYIGQKTGLLTGQNPLAYTIYAFNGDMVYDGSITVNKQKPSEFSTNLFRLSGTLKLIGAEDTIFMFGLVNPSVIEYNGFKETFYGSDYIYVQDTSISDEVIIEYPVYPQEGIKSLYYMLYETEDNSRVLKPGFEVYNFKTEEYEEMELISVLAGGGLPAADYLSPSGVFRIKLHVFPGSQLRLPDISFSKSAY